MTKKEKELREVATSIRRCRKCPLGKTRKKAVPGEGAHNARIMLVGEAPGKAEDEMGRPFVGYAGTILDKALKKAGLQREKVFITSILKCRPPRNRNPRASEMKACRPYLLRQIDTVSPEVIVALGGFGLKGLIGKTDRVGKMRIQKLDFAGTPVVSTYHPAAALYNRKLDRAIVSDLKKAKRLAK